MVPHYGYDGDYSDIALVEVKHPFHWTNSVKPACLPLPVKDTDYMGYAKKRLEAHRSPLMVSVRILVKDDRPLARPSAEGSAEYLAYSRNV